MGGRILLHVGASKCGSSAIQRALTAAPEFRGHDGREIRYGLLDTRAGLLREGVEVARRAKGAIGHVASPTLGEIAPSAIERLREALHGRAEDLVFSAEGWLFQPRQWAPLLEALDIEVDVAVYVRPQVEALNSAWWQWGAWMDWPFEDWLRHRTVTSMWGGRVRRWARIDRVRSLTVRPLPGDVVGDFYETVLHAPPPAGAPRVNAGLPGTVLRLFQRNRSLRPSQHSSRIDFVLANALELEEPTIWVMDEAAIARTLAATRRDTELLMSFMDEASAAAIRADARWWSPEAYAGLSAESPDPVPIAPERLEALCVALAEGLMRSAAGGGRAR